MAMIDMTLTPEDARKMQPAVCGGDESSLPKYPYGLSLYLCDESMKKLGLSEAPDAGQKFLLTAMVEVVQSGVRKTQEGAEANADLQITAMELAPAVGTTSEQRAAAFYDKPA
jgi:hypothetical protein